MFVKQFVFIRVDFPKTCFDIFAKLLQFAFVPTERFICQFESVSHISDTQPWAGSKGYQEQPTLFAFCLIFSLNGCLDASLGFKARLDAPTGNTVSNTDPRSVQLRGVNGSESEPPPARHLSDVVLEQRSGIHVPLERLFSAAGSFPIQFTNAGCQSASLLISTVFLVTTGHFAGLCLMVSFLPFVLVMFCGTLVVCRFIATARPTLFLQLCRQP
jgi:hypothetical protein